MKEFLALLFTLSLFNRRRRPEEETVAERRKRRVGLRESQDMLRQSIERLEKVVDKKLNGS